MLKKCEENDDECKTCQSKNCNAQSSFKKCLNCKMILGEDLHCAANPDLVHSKVCKAYNDKCYTSIENYSLSRGCMSDKDEIFHKECLKNSDKCGACTTGGGNGCNNQRIFTDKCVACDSGMYNYGCDTKPEVYKDKICNVLTSSKPEGCYLRVVGLNNKNIIFVPSRHECSLIFFSLIHIQNLYSNRKAIIINVDAFEIWVMN